MLIKPTKLEHARVELLKSISLKKNALEVPLEKASERISNKKIDSKLVVDKSIIGGTRIVVGDTVIDASVKGQLDNLAYSLKS